MRGLLNSIFVIFLFVSLQSLLSSCSDDDYLNAVPLNSKALVSFDLSTTVYSASDKGTPPYDNNISDLLHSLFGISDVAGCGIDWQSKAYMFESVDGNAGFVMHVSDNDALAETFASLHASGGCSKLETRNDCSFTVIGGSWVAGFSSKCLVIMGPVLPSQYVEICRCISGYLNQDADRGITSSPLFERICKMNGAVNIVSRVSALPEKFSSLFTLGAPLVADASQIMFAAEVSKCAGGSLVINAECFSSNKNTDSEIKRNGKIFRPVSETYMDTMSADALFSLFMNADGSRLINILHADKTLSVLLSGVNMAVDMDKIIKSVNGDMAVVIPETAADNMPFMLAARLSNKSFLDDVSYWKRSCPDGGEITDIRKDFYCYKNGKVSYYFGLSPDMRYYSGDTEKRALSSLSRASRPLPPSVKRLLVGSRLCAVVNFKALSNLDSSGVSYGLLNAVFGDVKYILYIVR